MGDTITHTNWTNHFRHLRIGAKIHTTMLLVYIMCRRQSKNMYILLFLLPNTDRLQQVQDNVRGYNWENTTSLHHEQTTSEQTTSVQTQTLYNLENTSIHIVMYPYSNWLCCSNKIITTSLNELSCQENDNCIWITTWVTLSLVSTRV
jgi:hypothetical protein